MITIIPKKYTREFPLILCEIWGREYKTFFGKKTKIFPRYMFVIRDGIVDAYINQDIYTELNQLFFNKAKNNPRYFKEFYVEYLQKFKDLENYWRRDYLTKSQLKVFVEKMIIFWRAIYASMYVPQEKKLFSKRDRDLMVALRKKIDTAADEATHIILRSLYCHYPDLGELINYITLKNLDKENISLKAVRDLARKELIMVDDIIVSRDKFKALKSKFNFKLEKVKINKRAKRIKGQVACQGKVKGKVQKVLKRSDVLKFKEGRVLISSMTVPDYLPAMKKAIAFITDEGGITCHAAIVAREMKIPCIIGTKVATQVLRDGDEVEVDANKGVVRILKKFNRG